MSKDNEYLVISKFTSCRHVPGNNMSLLRSLGNGNLHYPIAPEDNKVAEWADKYIDYERLKVYLKRAKKAAEAYDALEKRRPELAAEVKAAYDAGVPYSASATASAVSLSRKASEITECDFESEANGMELPESQGEAKPPVGSVSVGEKEELVPLVDDRQGESQERALQSGAAAAGETAKKQYGSLQTSPAQMTRSPFGSLNDLTSLVRQDSGTSLFGRVSGYFQHGNFANKLTHALKIIDENLDLFANCLEVELEKVTKFHTEKLDELEKRLEVLVESVGSNYDVISRPKHADEEGGNTTFLKLKAAVHKRVASIITKPAVSGSKLDADKVHHSLHENRSLVSESDEEAVKSDMLDVLRESDSIKRALTDLHRSTMLLNNYDVMNFTGFIKIIKKHAKSFPSRKGRFKGFMKKADIIEGNASEEVANRMEKLFAYWFCDGNVREARAKMLPKRGDGLQMDWSQLRLGYRLGMCAILTLWVCWDCIWGLVHDQQSSIGGRTAFPVFRGCGGLLLVHWFWGFSVFVWQRCEYVYLPFF